MRAQQTHRVFFDSSWRHHIRDTNVFDLNQCDTDRKSIQLLQVHDLLRPGKKHVWKIRVEAITPIDTMYLGVAAIASDLQRKMFVGNQGLGLLASTGNIIHCTRQQPTSCTFDKGDILKFTLDLTTAGNGSLAVSVHNKPEHVLFRNMLSRHCQQTLKDLFLPEAFIRLPEFTFLASMKKPDGPDCFVRRWKIIRTSASGQHAALKPCLCDWQRNLLQQI